MKTNTLSLICVQLLTGFAILQPAQAVVPPPDGGYPGFNTAEGQNALFNLTTGIGNTAVGWFSLFSNTDGSFNTALGAGTLLFNVGDQSTQEGNGNTAIGTAALLYNTTGFDNTAIGKAALLNNSIGYAHTATGTYALTNNISGYSNTANGYAALYLNTEGFQNTAVGEGALANNTTGRANTALGVGAGAFQTTGDGNVYIGVDVPGVAGENDACYISNIFGQTSLDGMPVLINSYNKLGTSTSSARFKDDIKAMDDASDKLFALKPVTFRYKKDIDPAGKSQFGLVAEEVEKVNPDLIVRDKEGKPYSVRYDQVNAMLLNEFLKEHKTVQELKKEIAALRTTVKHQNIKIQKVSD